MTPALSPPRRTKTSAVFATICMTAVAHTGASASPHQPGSGAHQAQAQALAAIAPATPCSWSEHYVNASAVPLAAVHMHVRGLRSPSAAQPDRLHCCGLRSPQCVLRDERVRSLMPAAAWEDCDESQGADSGSSRWHPELWPHDVTAVSSSDWDPGIIDLTAALADAASSSSHLPFALPWTADSEVQERHGRGALAFDIGGGSGTGTCPPRSSAAPAMRELALDRGREREHEVAPFQPRSRSGTVSVRREYGPTLRRAPASGISTSMSKSSAAHASLESTPRNTGTLAEAAAGSSGSFLGALYASYSLWELASVLAAIAWLLVCLAA